MCPLFECSASGLIFCAIGCLVCLVTSRPRHVMSRVQHREFAELTDKPAHAFAHHPASDEAPHFLSGKASPEYTPVAARAFAAQLRTPEFTFIMVHTLVCMFRANVYMGTIGDYLASIGDGEGGHPYQKAVGAIIPCGVFFVPAVSWLLTRRGFASSCWVVWWLGLFYEGCTLIEVKAVQLAGALVFTFYRAALYTIVAVYMSVVFGNATLGRISGIVYSVTGFVILLQVCACDAPPCCAWGRRCELHVRRGDRPCRDCQCCVRARAARELSAAQYPLVSLTNSKFGGSFLPMHVLMFGARVLLRSRRARIGLHAVWLCGSCLRYAQSLTPTCLACASRPRGGVRPHDLARLAPLTRGGAAPLAAAAASGAAQVARAAPRQVHAARAACDGYARAPQHAPHDARHVTEAPAGAPAARDSVVCCNATGDMYHPVFYSVVKFHVFF